MNAARYNVGSRDPLELADASARTIQKAVESAQQPAEIAQQPVETTPAPAGTQEALSQLGEFVSPNGFRPYQIRPPADYTPSTLDLPEGRVFRWAGSRYKSTPKRSSQHFLTVTLRKRASDTTAQEELEGQLKKLSSFKLKWQQGENSSETINGIPFLRCDYKYRRFPEEPVAEGFLYAALHDGTLVLMHSEQYDVVSRDHLELAQVSARTFQKQPESAPPPVVVQAVDRWKTFEPPTVQPVEFQPPPLDPEPVPDATDRLQLAKEDRLVALALQKARAERLGIFARFEPRADGSLKALINPGPTPDALTKSTLEQPLTFGNGIPLLRLDVAWEGERPSGQRLASRPADDAAPHYRLHTLELPKELQPRGNSSPIRKLLWSDDGESLFLLAGGHLLRVDASTWRFLAAVRPRNPVRDVAWSSQGLVALHYDSRSVHDPHPAKSWAKIETGPSVNSTFAEHRLLVLNPMTLAVERAWRVEGDALAGHPDRDLVYVYQSRRRRLLVVNVADGELVNMINEDSLEPLEFVESRGSGTRRVPARPGFAELHLTRGGRELLSISDIEGAFSLNRFLLTGPHVSCTVSWNNLPKTRGPIKVTQDGRFLVFPTLVPYGGLSSGGRTWLHFVRTEDFNETAGAVLCSSPLLQFAADPVSKTIVLAEGHAATLRDPQQLRLRFLQDDTSGEIPLGLEQPLEMWPHPQGRGVLLVTNVAAHWLEFKSRGERWSFERTAPVVLPAVACEIRPERPDDPLVPEETRDDHLEMPLNADWIGWAPDGTAWYALADRKHTMHRFDAATHRETHRLTIPAERNVVPRAFVTGEGIVFDHRGVAKLFLLDLQTLQPIWEMEDRHAYWPVGNPGHGIVAAQHGGGLVVFEAATARVRARATPFEIDRQWPEPCDNPISHVFPGADPSIVKCHRGLLVTFRLTDGELEYVDAEKKDLDRSEPQHEPQGFTYRIHESRQTLVVANPRERTYSRRTGPTGSARWRPIRRILAACCSGPEPGSISWNST